MVRQLGFISTKEAGTALDSYMPDQYQAAGLPVPRQQQSFSSFLEQNQTAIIAGAAALLLLAIVASMNR